MIAKLFRTLTQKYPFLRRAIWKLSYNYLARTYDQKFWSFMNYGFVSPDAGPIPLKPEDEADRYSIQLYHEVASAVPLAGLDVLEVGSGRGGGASYVARYLKPRTMTGVDFSAEAIRFCRDHHRTEGLSFTEGDAENLPFSDGTFDAVINVESSHCYGSMPKFLNEVKRVLRPGGYFLYADLRGKREMDLLRSYITNSGLKAEGYWDITSHVLEALDRDNDRKLDLIGQIVHGPLMKYFKEFAGVKEAGVYKRFQNGENIYFRFVLKKD